MKKLYGKIKSCFALVAFALLFGVSAQAQTIDNPTKLELGKEYSGKMFEDHYFYYVPEKDGKLICTGKAAPDFFTDATYETLDNSFTFSYVAGGKETQRDVVAGVTYYMAIRNEFEWSFTATMGDNSSIGLTVSNPEQNTYFDVSIGQLTLNFDTAVAYDSAILQVGTNAVEVSGMVYGRDISFDLKATLFAWLKDGVMKKDDVFTLTLSGVRSANNDEIKYNGDGVLVLSFLSPAKPGEIVNAKVPEKFLSYWAPDAEDGVVVLEYDIELSKDFVPNATIGFGSPEIEGDYYSENVPAIVDGKTLSLNFRGKKRIPSEMVLSGTEYEYFQLRVSNIRDINGNYVYTDGRGSYGSYQKQFSYELLSVNLVTEFLPASGSSLEGVNSVELWLSTDKAVAFNGVEVNYKKASGENACVIYTKEECNYKNEGVDGVTLNIPITAEMQSGTNVTITLYQEQSIDGNVREIEAVYNYVKPFEPIEIFPEPLTQVGDLSTIIFTYDEPVTLAEAAEAVLLAGNGRTKICSVSMKVEGYDVVFTLGKEVTDVATYILNVPQGAIINAEGRENDAMHLKYELIKIYEPGFNFEPEDGAVVNELSKISVINPEGLQVSWNYDAQLYLAGSSTPIATVFKSTSIEEVVDPDDFFAPVTKVIFTLKDPENSATDVVITAPGTYRLELPKGFFNIGNGYDTADSPAMTVTWTIIDPNTLVFTPADGSTVESLSEIIVDCAGGFGPSNIVERKAQIYDAAGAVVATVKKNNTPGDYIDKDTYLPSRVVMILDNTITTPGEYTLKIDKGYFYVDGWNMKDSEAMELHYTIFDPSGVKDIFGSEVEVYEVYNFAGVKVLSTENADELNNLPAGFYIINGKKVYLRK